MANVRIGLVGAGGMGMAHARYLAAGEIAGGELVAVCDSSLDKLHGAQEALGGHVRTHDNLEQFLKSPLDGVLIATPHFSHPPIAIRAFAHGLHVLTEKPAGVTTSDVRRMNEAAARSGKVFAIMFNLRVKPLYRKLKEMTASGVCGQMKRINWTVTDWYRPQSYYDSGRWRATWAGEGGGVLLNQCPHQLDLWQWLFGMPRRVRASCYFGKYHDIEVEDDVTAYMEYADGTTGVFITSTGEAPGTNRLEIAGDRAKVVVEDGRITLWENEIPERQFNREFKGLFGSPACRVREIVADGVDESHQGIARNWVRAIQHAEPLVANGAEGINSLELSNAMLLSTWRDDWITLPIDETLFCKEFDERVRHSRYHTPESKAEQPCSATSASGRFHPR